MKKKSERPFKEKTSKTMNTQPSIKENEILYNDKHIFQVSTVTWFNKNKTVYKGEIDSVRETLSNIKITDKSFCNTFKNFVCVCYTNLEEDNWGLDVLLKLLRKAIDCFEKPDDFQSLLNSCHLLFEGTSILVARDSGNQILTVESWQKGIKLLFHINKHFYKRNLLQSTIHLNSCIQNLYKYSISTLSNDVTSSEIKKVFFMMHQMSYSLFTKEIQKIANKKCNVTELFSLRTQCLVLLSFTDWMENKLPENIKDFSTRWIKILSNSQYSFDVELIFQQLSNLHYFLSNLALKHSDLLSNITSMQYQLFEMATRLASLNQKCQTFYRSYFPTNMLKLDNVSTKRKNNIDFMIVSSQLLLTVNSDHTESKCTCNFTVFETFLVKIESYLKSNPAVNDFMKYYSWLKSMFLLLKSVKCSTILKFAMEISTKVLSSDYVWMTLEKSSKDVREMISSFLYYQVINILQSADEKLSSINGSEEWLNPFIDFQVSLRSFVPALSPENQELKWLSAASYKIGLKLYHAKDYTVSLQSFLLAMVCSKALIAQEGEDQSIISKHLKELSTMCSTMYSCFSQLKQFNEGYVVLCEHLCYLGRLNLSENNLRCPESRDMNQTLIEQLWKLKSRSSSNLEQEKCIFEDIEEKISPNFLLFVMVLEVECLQNMSDKSNSYAMQHFKILEAQKNIYEQSGELLDYAVTMIKISSQVNVERNERFLQAQEASSVLEEMLNEMEGDEETSQISDVLAMAYYQQACVLYEERVQESIENADDSMTKVIDKCLDQNPDIESEDATMMDQFKLQDFLNSEFATMLNSALEMWLICFEHSKNNGHQDMDAFFYNTTATAQCLYETSVLFSLLYQNFQSIQASYMSIHIYERQLQRNKNMIYTEKLNNSLVMLTMQLFQLDCLPLGEFILNRVLDQKDENNADDRIDIVKAAYHVKQGQVGQSLDILGRVLMKKNMDKNTKNTLLMKSEVYSLLSSLKLLANDERTSCKLDDHHFPPASPFPPALDCIKYLRSLFENCLNAGNGEMVLNWMILDKLLSCLVHHAELLKHQGSIMESKAYLKEALVLAKKYNLPLRILDVMIRITSIDIILENKTSFDRNFGTVKNVLNASVGQCFSDDDQENDHNNSNNQIYLPDFLTHVAECSCTYCTNSYLQEFYIKFYLQYVDSRKSFHRSRPLPLSDYKEAIDSLTAKADEKFQTSLTAVKQLLNYQGDDSSDSVTGKKGRKGASKKSKKSEPATSVTNVDGTRKFSKYITEARLLGEHTGMNSSSSSSAKMVSNVEFLISKLEIDAPQTLSEEKTSSTKVSSSHDFQRLIAQLYYLRSLLYLGKNNNNNNNNNNSNSNSEQPLVNEEDNNEKTKEAEDNEKEEKCQGQIKRKTRGRKTVTAAAKSATKSTTTTQRKTTRKMATTTPSTIAEEVSHNEEEGDKEAEGPKRKTKGTTRRKRRTANEVELDNGLLLTDDIQKLSLKDDNDNQKPGSRVASTNNIDGTNASIPKMNKSFLEDLRKVLGLLNPYTDTLIIKAIYQLISFMASTTSGVDDNDVSRKLATTTQLLASSRTLHQQVLSSIGKKIRKRSDSSPTISSSIEGCLINSSSLIEKYSRPDFPFGEENLEVLVDQSIPKGWTVCCLSLTELSGRQSLIISRTQPDKGSTLMKIDIGGDETTRGASNDRGVVCELASAFDQGLLEKYQEILEDSRNSMLIKDKRSWWTERQRLDAQMKSLVERIESDWLQGWGGFLLGERAEESQETKVDEKVDAICQQIHHLDVKRSLLRVLVDGYSENSNETQLLHCLKQICGVRDASQVFKVFVDVMKAELKPKNTKSKLTQATGANSKGKRKHVVLILDKVLQTLPWECIPSLHHHPVVRMPSLLLTSTHCLTHKEMLETGLNTKDTFYILNPRNDLKRTEQIFHDSFKEEGWEGIVGRTPSAEEFSKALTHHDLFVYCGHGSGQEYLGWDSMQRLHCKAVALLMGCSSGKLVSKGSLEAQGMAQYYLLSGSPAVVGNLWDVTDRDIDLFLQHLLKIWVTESTGRDLADCVSEARSACKLEYLIGGAPVVYGLPLVVR